MGTAVFGCSTCGKQFRVVPEQAGRKVRCPHCETPNSVPDNVFAAPAPPQDDAEDLNPLPESVQRLAASVQTIAGSERRPASQMGVGASLGLRYTHSRFAKNAHTVSLVVFGIAVLVLVYVLATGDWRSFFSLPIKEALLLAALILMPSATLGLTGVFLMGMAQRVEYLARIAGKSSR